MGSLEDKKLWAEGNDRITESLVLDTLMYCDEIQRIHFDNDTDLNTVVNILSEKCTSDEGKNALNLVKEYIATHDDFGKQMKISSVSGDLGDNVDGAFAAAFYRENGSQKEAFIAFRGTGDGRWFDNGDAFAQKYSRYQQDATQYFDIVANDLGLDESWDIIATGHSKGGNLAQFIALDSRYGGLIDNVYSFDGEGFSPEAIEYFKSLYPDEEYQRRLKLMYSINGDNDYVNPLGIKVIPDENTIYVKTPTGDLDIVNAHAIYDKDGKSNLMDFSTGKFYEFTEDRRMLSKSSQHLSDYMMTLPAEDREAVSRSIMSGLELYNTGEDTLYVGLHGEVATPEEVLLAFQYIDEIGGILLADFSEELLKKYGNEVCEKFKKLNIFSPTFSYDLFSLGFAAAKYVGVMGLLIVGEAFINFIGFLNECYYKLNKKLEALANLCVTVYTIIKKGLRYIFDSGYRNALKYLNSNYYISVNTDSLREIADSLSRVCRRLDYLGDNVKQYLNNPIFVPEWAKDLGSSAKLNNCVNYLNDTASRFEDSEKKILKMLG